MCALTPQPLSKNKWARSLRRRALCHALEPRGRGFHGRPRTRRRRRYVPGHRVDDGCRGRHRNETMLSPSELFALETPQVVCEAVIFEIAQDRKEAFLRISLAYSSWGFVLAVNSDSCSASGLSFPVSACPISSFAFGFAVSACPVSVFPFSFAISAFPVAVFLF